MIHTVARATLSLSCEIPAIAGTTPRALKNASKGARRILACNAPSQRRAIAALGNKIPIKHPRALSSDCGTDIQVGCN
jgi:hypothetical protein